MTLARPDKCLAGSIETSVLDNLLCNMPPKHTSTANKLRMPNQGYSKYLSCLMWITSTSHILYWLYYYGTPLEWGNLALFALIVNDEKYMSRYYAYMWVCSYKLNDYNHSILLLWIHPFSNCDTQTEYMIIPGDFTKARDIWEAINSNILSSLSPEEALINGLSLKSRYIMRLVNGCGCH